MKGILGTIVVATMLMTPAVVSAGTMPVGFSAKGGIGVAYVSMNELNSQFSLLRRSLNTDLVSIDNGFQAYIEGRVWFFDRVAAIVGWEHYWIDASIDAGTYALIFKAPTSTILVGGAVKVFGFPEFVDINLGVRGSFSNTIYGSNELLNTAILDEYKNNAYGWDIFAETTTAFLRPVEVGFILGYRNLEISELKNKFDDRAEHSISGKPVVLDFSGAYFYMTAGFRLW